MNLTYRQLILLTTALTVFYDEVAKTSTPEMKQELMELSQIVQSAAMEAQYLGGGAGPGPVGSNQSAGPQNGGSGIVIIRYLA